jgi:hypothetical protein
MELPPPVTPSTDHVTLTLEVNCRVPLGATVADAGETVGVTAVATVTVAVAVALFVESWLLVALTVWLPA